MMAGALLARAGVEVLVLEKHGDFLRDFRGDTVHPSTMEVLAELGWLDEFLERPHTELRRIRAHIGGREVTLADFHHVPARRRFVALVPQWEFLDFIAGKARCFPSFSVWMNAEAKGIVDSDGRVTGVRGERRGEPFLIRADLVLGCDGRHSSLRGPAGLRVHDVSTPIDVLWFRLSRRAGDPEQGLGWLSEKRFFVLLDRGDYWQVGSIVPKGSFDAVRAKGIDAFREGIARAVPFLGDRVAELDTFDAVKLLSVKIDRLERWWREGLLFIGDAAHSMSPVGGVGINLAIQDAVAAANLLAGPLLGGTLTTRDLARVQQRRELAARGTQAVQKVVQDRVLRRVLEGRRLLHVGVALRALDRSRLLQRIPARLIGLGLRPEHVAVR
jgi:2-polyprenyl-6-methoxyphenol hydroxylase-like FAD-dependent oxidoreductase